MMAAKVIVFTLLLVGCCYTLPFKVATIYGSPVPTVLVKDLEEPRAGANEEIMYTLNSNSETPSSFDVMKRSVQKTDDEDLEVAAGTNILRPLFVYRQQVAYQQRARGANRRGRQI